MYNIWKSWFYKLCLWGLRFTLSYPFNLQLIGDMWWDNNKISTSLQIISFFCRYEALVLLLAMILKAR